MSTIPMMGGSPPQGGNPMQGYGNAGGGAGDPMSLYQGYGWNPQQTPMNFGGPYGPMSWPSWNQQSMNAGGLYGAMFNPWLMMQGGQQPGGSGGAATPPVPNQQTPAPSAPVTSLASPHFAYMTGTGTPAATQSPAWNPMSVSNIGTDKYLHNAALAHGGPGVTQTEFSARDLLRFPGPQ